MKLMNVAGGFCSSNFFCIISENFTSRYLPFLMRKLFFFFLYSKNYFSSALAHTSPNFIFHNKLQYSPYYVTLILSIYKNILLFHLFFCYVWLFLSNIKYALIYLFFFFLSLSFFSTISTLL